jgi:hypothetical protein
LAEDYKESPFVRTFKAEIWDSIQDKFVFVGIFDTRSGKFHARLGVDSDSGFAIYRGGEHERARGVPQLPAAGFVSSVLVAVSQLVIDANKSVDEFSSEISEAAQIKPR